jgi:tRNA(Ile)-lysidine synthase
VTREEILTYLKKHRLTYCIDKSNQDTTYKRNYIRNQLLVDIRKHLNPAVDMVLRNLADTMMEEEQYLDSIVYQTYKKVVKITVGGKLELDLNKYNKYAKWLRRRLLRYCLTEGLGIVLMPDRTTVDRLDIICQRRLKAVSLPESVRAVTVGEKIVLMRGKISGYTVELERSRKVEIPGLNLQMKYQISDYKPGMFSKERRSNRAVLAWDSIRFPLSVRNIRTGDRFQPLGMKGHKKIGDYLTDRKVPPVYRDEIPVVCDRDGIVWLAGYEIADRVKVMKSTGKVVKVECVKQRQGAAKTI